MDEIELALLTQPETQQNWYQTALDFIQVNESVVIAGIGLLSLIIAGLTALTIFKTLKSQHRHNVLSVKPLITFQKKPIYQKNGEFKGIDFIVHNSGLGPAVLKSFTFKGKDTNEVDIGGLKQLLNCPLEIKLTHWTFAEGFTMRPGLEFEVYKIRFDNIEKEILNTVNAYIYYSLSLIEIKFEYKDIYENVFIKKGNAHLSSLTDVKDIETNNLREKEKTDLYNYVKAETKAGK